jgi:hypothetical protein
MNMRDGVKEETIQPSQSGPYTPPPPCPSSFDADGSDDIVRNITEDATAGHSSGDGRSPRWIAANR